MRERGARAVCKRCHTVMDDCEPMGRAEFFHKTTFGDGTKNACKNAGKSFFEYGKEVEPFMTKRARRHRKRNSR